jgi:DNA polymerase delta subunit 1
MTEKLKPQKRVLTDATNSSRNVMPTTISKKRKLGPDESNVNFSVPSRDVGPKAFGSSQPLPKSQFEEVLEKMSQDISGLRQKNSEKDQQWERPPLKELDETKDNLCFQQIDVEEGTLQGGKTAVKLFGVTEVIEKAIIVSQRLLLIPARMETLFFFMLLDFSTIFTLLRLSISPKPTVILTKPS